jgi:hypothetical protein
LGQILIVTPKSTELPNSQVLSGVTRWETEAQAVAVVSGFWGRLAARVRSWFEIPFGYEDETGFHYGPAPTPEWAKKTSSAAPPVLTDRASSVIQYDNAKATTPGAVAAPDKKIAPPDSVSAA